MPDLHHAFANYVLKPLGFVTGLAVAATGVPAPDAWARVAGILGGCGSLLIGIGTVLNAVTRARLANAQIAEGKPTR
jgi:hypothetical protein